MSDLVINQQKPKLKIPGKTIIKWVILLVVLSTIWGLANRGIRYTQTEEFCASCHNNQFVFETRDNSSHSKFTCNSCHNQWQEPELNSFKQAAREIYKQFIPYPMPELLAGKYRITDDVCLACHSFARNITPSGDLIIPHEDHKAKKVQCITCHAGLVHGEKNHRGIDNTPVLITGEYVRETPDNNPPMGLCMSCHRRRQVTLACEACHTDLKLPDEHLRSDFKTNHGRQARGDIQSCDSCHRYAASSLFLVQNRGNVVEYARQNPFCGDCHANMPPTHLQPNFIFRHGQVGDLDTCMTCHNNNPGTGVASATTQCNSCHYQSHSPNWQKKHPVPVNINSDWKRECYSCHQESTCRSCHRY